MSAIRILTALHEPYTDEDYRDFIWYVRDALHDRSNIVRAARWSIAMRRRAYALEGRYDGRHQSLSYKDRQVLREPE